MAFLCIAKATPNKKNIPLEDIEYELIQDGEVWEIDRYTMNFEDSKAIRHVNEDILKKFHTKYPDEGDGYLYLFTSDIKKDTYQKWPVLYEKHFHAFFDIIKMPKFMNYYSKISSPHFAPFDRDMIFYHPEKLEEHMKRYCKNLQKKDRETNPEPFSDGVTKKREGGLRYYTFIRDTIYWYNEYCKKYTNAPTIEELYNQYWKNKKAKFLARTSPSFPPQVEEEVTDIPEIDSDILLYAAMDKVEGEVDSLTSFVSSPDFDRTYRDVFEDHYLFLLGTRPEDIEAEEDYQTLTTYLENGFNGMVVSPHTGKNMNQFSFFHEAKIVIFYVKEVDSSLETQIALALANKALVAILAGDTTIYARYQRKYRDARTILFDRRLENNRINNLGEFIIDAYKLERNYQK